MRINNCTTLFILSLLLLEAITIKTTTTEAFVHVPDTIGSPVVTTRSSVLLFAAATKKRNNNNKKKGGGGGGFGISGTTKSSNNNGSSDGGTTTTSTTTTAKLIAAAAADKNSLEQKWDAFASITDLEIKPIGNPEEDDNYDHFEVVDVFVRSGGSGSTTSSDDDNNSKASGNSNAGWYRIGKVCAIGIEYGGTTSIEAALVLQKGLILWTSVHMRRELMAKGSSAASSLELGYISPPILYMGCDTDKPIDEDEVQQYLKIVDKKLLPAEELSKVQSNTYGFRPDWNPPGFTYKRREKAAMKKKNSNKKKTLEEILDE